MNLEPLRSLGYRVHYDGQLNIVAERRYPHRYNEFNDRLIVAYRSRPHHLDYPLTIHEFKLTTLPGAHYLSNLLNPKGTAILAPGQYRYKLGSHRGKPALVQAAPVTVYRDKNRDQNFDLVDPETGYFGINIHRAGRFSHFVNSWSAGCQVFQREDDFEFFLNLCESVAHRSHGMFHYTLIDEGTL